MKTLLQLRDEIGAWAKQFKVERPELGIIEEIGECAHVYLKSLQGIRGYDDPVKVKEDVADSIADAGTYALHFCSLRKIIPPDTADVIPSMDAFQAFRLASRCASYIIASEDDLYAEKHIPHLFNALATLGYIIAGVNFLSALSETWENTVSKRDWKTNPNNAHLQSGSPESNQSSRPPKQEGATLGNAAPSQAASSPVAPPSTAPAGNP